MHELAFCKRRSFWDRCFYILIALTACGCLSTTSFSTLPAQSRDAKQSNEVDVAGLGVLRWLPRWGATVHEHLETRIVPSKGRCLFASRPVPNGTILVQLSAELMLPALEDRDVLLRLSSHFPNDLALEVRCCLAILRARQDPEWSPYVRVWPCLSELSGLPTFWSDERLAAAANSMPGLRSSVDERRLFVAKAARLFDIDEDEFTYAHALLCTRAVGGTNSCTLVPGVDFANHDPVAFNSRIMHAGTLGKRDGAATISQSGQVWEHGSGGLVAVQDIAAGEEVRITYGPLPDEELLLDYGFTLGDGNPHRISEQRGNMVKEKTRQRSESV